MLSAGLFLMHLLGLNLASLGDMLLSCLTLLVVFKDGVQNQGCSCTNATASEVTDSGFTLAAEISGSHMQHCISFLGNIKLYFFKMGVLPFSNPCVISLTGSRRIAESEGRQWNGRP